MTRVGASFFFYPYTAVTHSAPSDAFTSCADTPDVAAITSGSVTSFDTKTESDDAAAHVASEKVEFWMIESSARSNTVALKSSHVMPAMPSDTATIGVRVGLGVGTGVGAPSARASVQGSAPASGQPSAWAPAQGLAPASGTRLALPSARTSARELVRASGPGLARASGPGAARASATQHRRC